MPKFLIYSGFVMGGLFVLAGLATVLIPASTLDAQFGKPNIPFPVLGVLVLAYGAFRIFRSYRALQHDKLMARKLAQKERLEDLIHNPKPPQNGSATTTTTTYEDDQQG